MKTVCIVQARLGSKRLPGKVLRPLCGQPMLLQQLRRLQRCTSFDELIVATSDTPDDDPISSLCRSHSIDCFRGAEHDVLRRFADAASFYRADVIVRITADCPLIDSQVTDSVVQALLDEPSRCDYAANVVRRTYPRGLDTEALFFDTLLRLNRLASSAEEREHVTVLPRRRPDLFQLKSIEDREDNSFLRWTVDVLDDFLAIEHIYEELGLSDRAAPYDELLKFCRTNTKYQKLAAKAAETWDPSSR